MKRGLSAVLCATGLAISGCQQEADTFDPPYSALEEPVRERVEALEAAATRTPRLGPISEIFDCVRETDGMLIASHRGGPARGYPENAIETLEHATSAGIVIHEIDVVESRDGVLFLLHDRTLGRTTTGDGAVADTDWADIQSLNLKDNFGNITDFKPPKLSDVLLWARANQVIVELDKKPTTSFRNIISHVRAADAEQNVILITYNDSQAIEVARLAPDLMMTASVDSSAHQRDLEASGVNFDNVIAWMGTRNPNPAAFAALGRRGVETAFGTLGRAGERLDDAYWQDGDPREYQDLADGGLTLLATDEPYLVADALYVDDRAIDRCFPR